MNTNISISEAVININLDFNAVKRTIPEFSHLSVSRWNAEAAEIEAMIKNIYFMRNFPADIKVCNVNVDYFKQIDRKINLLREEINSLYTSIGCDERPVEDEIFTQPQKVKFVVFDVEMPNWGRCQYDVCLDGRDISKDIKKLKTLKIYGYTVEEYPKNNIPLQYWYYFD